MRWSAKQQVCKTSASSCTPAQQRGSMRSRMIKGPGCMSAQHMYAALQASAGPGSTPAADPHRTPHHCTGALPAACCSKVYMCTPVVCMCTPVGSRLMRWCALVWPSSGSLVRRFLLLGWSCELLLVRLVRGLPLLSLSRFERSAGCPTGCWPRLARRGTALSCLCSCSA